MLFRSLLFTSLFSLLQVSTSVPFILLPQTTLLLSLTDPKPGIHLVLTHAYLATEAQLALPSFILLASWLLRRSPFMRFGIAPSQVVFVSPSHGNQPCLYPSLRRSGADEISAWEFLRYSVSYRRQRSARSNSPARMAIRSVQMTLYQPLAPMKETV